MITYIALPGQTLHLLFDNNGAVCDLVEGNPSVYKATDAALAAAGVADGTEIVATVYTDTAANHNLTTNTLLIGAVGPFEFRLGAVVPPAANTTHQQGRIWSGPGTPASPFQLGS